MKNGGIVEASRWTGPKSVRCSSALPPPYQCMSSPTVMWARASMWAPECDVAMTYSAM